MTFDLPSEIVGVILAARCPSTKIIYAGRGEKFVVCCSSGNVLCLQAQLTDLLLFCLSLARRGLAIATVKGYLSALSAFLSLPDQPSLFKSPVVMHFF